MVVGSVDQASEDSEEARLSLGPRVADGTLRKVYVKFNFGWARSAVTERFLHTM